MNVRAVDEVRVPIIDLRATGQNIRRMREDAGISVRDLQMIFGFTNPQAIYKWQNGDSLPSIDNFVILAAVLGVTVDEILVIEDCSPDPKDVTFNYSAITGIDLYKFAKFTTPIVEE